jgi:hypothetical protein
MIRTRVLIRRERSTDGRSIAQATSVVTTSSSQPAASNSTATDRGIRDERSDASVEADQEADQTAEVYTSTARSHSHSRSSSRCSSSKRA